MIKIYGVSSIRWHFFQASGMARPGTVFVVAVGTPVSLGWAFLMDGNICATFVFLV